MHTNLFEVEEAYHHRRMLPLWKTSWAKKFVLMLMFAVK